MASDSVTVDPTYAQTLKALHRPGEPLVVTNVHDLSSLQAVLSLNTSTDKPVKAVATASYSIAETIGTKDGDLTLQQNLAAIAPIARATRAAGIPLTADLQDGYGEEIESAIQEAVRLGVSGANLEDRLPGNLPQPARIETSLYSLDVQVDRLKRALQVAAKAGVSDFVINARTDVMTLDPRPEGALEETIRRGKAYLAAGAMTVFVWGGGIGLSSEDIKALVQAFDGRLSVLLSRKPDGLSVKELANLGVARISIGPTLWLIALAAVKETATRLLAGGKVFVG